MAGGVVVWFFFDTQNAKIRIYKAELHHLSKQKEKVDEVRVGGLEGWMHVHVCACPCTYVHVHLHVR